MLDKAAALGLAFVFLACQGNSFGHPGPEMTGLQFDLNQVTLPALDLEESIDFYTRFGLEIIVNSPETQYARFEIPGSQATLSIHVEARGVRKPSVDLYFETANPDEIVSRLRERGIESIEALEDKPWLWREAWFVDPFGNRLCIYFAGENRKNPPWRVRDQGLTNEASRPCDIDLSR